MHYARKIQLAQELALPDLSVERYDRFNVKNTFPYDPYQVWYRWKGMTLGNTKKLNLPLCDLLVKSYDLFNGQKFNFIIWGIDGKV